MKTVKTVINNKITYRTEPKSGASANSATGAYNLIILSQYTFIVKKILLKIRGGQKLVFYKKASIISLALTWRKNQKKRVQKNTDRIAMRSVPCLEERMGFEPTNAINVTAFPMLRLRPLGHLSVFTTINILSYFPGFVNTAD